MTTTIDIEKLGKAKGLNKETAAAICDVYDTYEELAGADALDLVDTVEGLDEASATAAVKFAKIKTKATSTNQPAAAPIVVGEEEEVSKVTTTQAPPGTTAVKKMLRRSGSLARQLGLPEDRYLGCTFCKNDLELAAEDDNLRPEQYEVCPYCTAAFVAEQRTFCYSCGQQMSTNGTCVKCGATANDDMALKAMTILVRREQGTNGRVARATANTLLQDPSYAAQIAARARAERWIEKAEEGPTGSMPPFGNVASSTSVGARGVNVGGHVGGSIVTGDGNRVDGITPQLDWPSRLEHSQLISLIDAMAAFSKEELIEVARESGVDHEILPYSNLSGLRRELANYHHRHSSIARLMTALAKHRPQTGWAQVIGIVDEKAGMGDTIFTGDARGAIVNYGTTIIGGTQYVDNRDK
jgi:hypothetical protein